MTVSKEERETKWKLYKEDAEYIAITRESNLAFDIATENGVPMGQVFTPEREQEWQKRRKAIMDKHGL